MTYLVDTGRARKRYRTYHVNLLRKWLTREQMDNPQINLVFPDVDNSNADNVEMEWKKVSINHQLDDEKYHECEKLLQSFSGVFSSHPGLTSLAEFQIKITDETPITQRAYSIPHTQRQAMKEELDSLLNLGIIERANSPWASPTMFVPKKGGQLRLVQDYRKLNSVTEFDAYPMPLVDEIIDGIGHSTLISTIDLTKGYYQIPISESARAKSAFVTPFGQFQFTRMAFGFKNAPACYQRMMDTLLGGIDHVQAFLDDVVIYSETWDDHLRKLADVLKRLQNAGLKANPKKCSFCMTQTEYLGKMVGDGEVSPLTEKVEAINRFPRPQTKTQIRRFLGMVNYYKDHIENLSKKASPLTDLLKKSKPAKILWDEDCEKAFKSLKKVLTVAPILRIADHSLPFFVQADASDKAVGVVLTQKHEGKEHPIAFRSKKLSDTQQRWSTIERELYAIVFGIEQFRYYIYGRHFVIQSDHKPLAWLQTMKNQNCRLMRWSMLLQQYQFTVEHRSGKANANSDFVSRLVD